MIFDYCSLKLISYCNCMKYIHHQLVIVGATTIVDFIKETNFNHLAHVPLGNYSLTHTHHLM